MVGLPVGSPAVHTVDYRRFALEEQKSHLYSAKNRNPMTDSQSCFSAQSSVGLRWRAWQRSPTRCLTHCDRISGLKEYPACFSLPVHIVLGYSLAMGSRTATGTSETRRER